MAIPELKQQLASEYKYRTELHAHTCPVSGCSQITPEDMARTYAGLGFDAVVLTNHFIYDSLCRLPKSDAITRYLKDYEDTRAEAEKYGLKILLGAEIRFCENINDYLIYGVDRELLETTFDYLPKGLEAFRRDVSLNKSVFIQAHPFRDNMTRVDPELLDGMETFNMHPNHNSRIGMASRYANENSMRIKTAGTDFHHPGQKHEGLSALRTKTLPADSFELAEILKSGDFLFEIGDGSLVFA